MPAAPDERMATGIATPSDPSLQQAVQQALPPALGPANPLASLAEDRATRDRSQGPAPAPLGGTLMPGVDMGQMPRPAGVTPPAPVQSEIIGPPVGPPIDQTLQPPGQQVGPAPLVPPVTPAPAPAAVPGAPVVPRTMVTPQTPLHPEDTSTLPPLPPTNVPNVPAATPASAVPAGLGPGDPFEPTTESYRPGFMGLFDREHFVGGPGLTRPVDPALVTDYTKSADPGRGKYKYGEHERLGGRIGRVALGAPAFVVGGPGLAGPAQSLGGLIGRGISRLIDPNRQVFEFGRDPCYPQLIAGANRGKGKDKDKDKKAPGISGPSDPSDPAGIRSGMGGGGGSGLGSDRGYGGFGGYGGNQNYGGYIGGVYGGYGGSNINQGIGGAFRNR